MKSLLLQFAVTVAALFVALMLYDAYHAYRQHQEAPALAADAKRQAALIVDETARQALEASRKQAEAIAEESRRQAEAIAEENRKAIEANRARSEELAAANSARAVLAGDLARAAAVRVALTECYNSMGAWPADMTQCGIDAAGYKGHLLDEVRLESGGRYVLVLHAGYGVPAGEVRFTPSATGASILWNCATESYAEIARIIPTCRYEGNGAAPAAAGGSDSGP
ncbi:hypothetical protein [Dokdonella soli]|uniref:Uncharacterized protein n=1 Tax=Dokdonella soli TaxID=529810 RepID=A0ABN1IWH4_9GAMM